MSNVILGEGGRKVLSLGVSENPSFYAVVNTPNIAFQVAGDGSQAIALQSDNPGNLTAEWFGRVEEAGRARWHQLDGRYPGILSVDARQSPFSIDYAGSKFLFPVIVSDTNGKYAWRFAGYPGFLAQDQVLILTSSFNGQSGAVDNSDIRSLHDLIPQILPDYNAATLIAFASRQFVEANANAVASRVNQTNVFSGVQLPQPIPQQLPPQPRSSQQVLPRSEQPQDVHANQDLTRRLNSSQGTIIHYRPTRERNGCIKRGGLALLLVAALITGGFYWKGDELGKYIQTQANKAGLNVNGVWRFFGFGNDLIGQDCVITTDDGAQANIRNEASYDQEAIIAMVGPQTRFTIQDITADPDSKDGQENHWYQVILSEKNEVLVAYQIANPEPDTRMLVHSSVCLPDKEAQELK